MIQQSDNTLATIGEVARSAIPGTRVLLFGSHARGQADPDSDYDILIITDRAMAAGDKIALRTRIRKQLLERGIRSDVLIQSEQEVQKKKELPGHIVRSALRDGVPL
ncbi:MAG TPA: nucleotidyltransferase domain-containing protein [Sedimentisphaerales bacterium]|nr:nucleotidyltransferase domain-containing protein [Sedimentisphaerales bacterium]